MISPHLQCFLFGMAGNVSVELVKILKYAERRKYHAKYGDWRFWSARLLLVALSGVMALAWSVSGVSSAVMSFHVGVAATLLIEWMSRNRPETPNGTDGGEN